MMEAPIQLLDSEYYGKCKYYKIISMSCSELTKLVKAYTNGEIPLEVYREQRRQIVDKVVEEPKHKKSNDPLDAFIASAPQKQSPHNLKSSTILLTVVGAVLVIGIGVFLLLNNRHDADNRQQNANDGANSTPTENKTHAQKLVEKFLRSDQWNEETINQFILDWQILSSAERQEAQNTAWFTRFKSVIQNHLESEKLRTNKTASLSEDLLTSLLVTVDPGHFIRQPFFSEKSPPSVQRPSAEPVTPSQPLVIAGEQNQPPEPAKAVKAPPSESKKPPTVKPKVAMRKTPSVVKAVDPVKLNNILSHFVASFQAGNLTTLMQLFSPHATTNYHSSAAEISNSYAELFQTTDIRELQFSDFSWKSLGSKVEGSGKYLAHLNPKGTNVDQVFTADVSITVDNSGDDPLILGLYLTNQQFSTNLRQAAKATTPAVPTPPPLENNELRVLLTNFVTAYNRGNIDSLMGLFSQEARTNDRSNINDIRDDYVQLFKTTRSREIVLTNITWDVDGTRAVANGFFEAKIQPLAGGDATVYRGKIRIAVTKFEGGILITQLLHNTF